MVDRAGHAFGIQKILDRYKLRTVTRESNANSITYYLATSQKIVKRIERDLEAEFPAATVTVRRVAIVAAVGSNLDVAGLLSRCVLGAGGGRHQRARGAPVDARRGHPLRRCRGRPRRCDLRAARGCGGSRGSAGSGRLTGGGKR
jgi:hypothetical protein